MNVNFSSTVSSGATIVRDLASPITSDGRRESLTNIWREKLDPNSFGNQNTGTRYAEDAAKLAQEPLETRTEDFESNPYDGRQLKNLLWNTIVRIADNEDQDEQTVQKGRILPIGFSMVDEFEAEKMANSLEQEPHSITRSQFGKNVLRKTLPQNG